MTENICSVPLHVFAAGWPGPGRFHSARITRGDNIDRLPMTRRYSCNMGQSAARRASSCTTANIMHSLSQRDERDCVSLTAPWPVHWRHAMPKPLFPLTQPRPELLRVRGPPAGLSHGAPMGLFHGAIPWGRERRDPAALQSTAALQSRRSHYWIGSDGHERTGRDRLNNFIRCDEPRWAHANIPNWGLVFPR